MKEIENYNEIKEFSDFPRLVAGAYPCIITKVEDFSDKEYLHIEFDIVDGEYKGYFKSQQDAFGGSYRGYINRSYVNEKAVRFFKSAITAIEKSNKGYVWDWNENKLVGKYLVVNFREEEYVNRDNELAISVMPYEIRSAEAYRNKEIKIAPRKCLSDDEKRKLAPTPESVDLVEPDMDMTDLPF